VEKLRRFDFFDEQIRLSGWIQRAVKFVGELPAK
jgi:hypothetical protein